MYNRIEPEQSGYSSQSISHVVYVYNERSGVGVLQEVVWGSASHLRLASSWSWVEGEAVGESDAKCNDVRGSVRCVTTRHARVCVFVSER